MAMVELQGRETGGGGEKYESHSERRFTRPAGMLSASERLLFFFFVLSDWGAETLDVRLSVTHEP